MPYRTLLRTTRVALVAMALLPLLYAGELGLPRLYFPAITAKHVVWQCLLAIAIGCWAPLALWHPGHRPRRSGLLSLAGLGVAIAVVTASTGIDPRTSWLGSLERLDGAVHTVALALYFVVAQSVLDQRWWRRLMLASLVVATLVAILALLQSAHGLFGAEVPRWLLGPARDAPDETRFFRATGRFGSGVFLALYLALHAGLTLALARTARGPTVTALATLACLFGTGVLATQTRITTLAMLLCFAWFGLAAARDPATSRSRRRALIAMLAIGALVVVIPLVALALDPVRFEQWPGLSRATSALGELARRSLLCQVAIDGFGAHPWLGVGSGNFELVWDRHFEPRLWKSGEQFDDPHNAALAWASAAGIPGLAWVLGLSAALWRSAGHHLSPRARLATKTMLCIYALHAAFQPTELCSHIALWSIAAFTCVARRTATTLPLDGHVTGAALALAGGIAAALMLVPISIARDAAAVAQIYDLGEDELAPETPALAERAYAATRGGRAEREACHEIGSLAVRVVQDHSTREAIALPLCDLAIRARTALHAEHPARVNELLLAAVIATQLAVRVRGTDRDRSMRLLEQARQLLADGLSRSRQRASLHEALSLVYLGLPGQHERALQAARTGHEVSAGNLRSAHQYIVVALVLRRFDLARPLAESCYAEGQYPLRWPPARVLEASENGKRPQFWLSLLRPRVGQLQALVLSGRLARAEARRRCTAFANLQAASGRRGAAVATMRAAVAWDPEFGPNAERQISTW